MPSMAHLFGIFPDLFSFFTVDIKGTDYRKCKCLMSTTVLCLAKIHKSARFCYELQINTLKIIVSI